MQKGLQEILSFFLWTLQQEDTVPAWAVLPLFGTPWTVAHQAPLFMEFSRQEYWSGLLFPTPEDLSNPGTEAASCVSFIGIWILYH